MNEEIIDDVSEELPDEVLESDDAPCEKCAELKDDYLRLMAEYDNFRKRTQREKDAIRADSISSVIEKLLPTLDNIERAYAYETTGEDFKKGIDMIIEGLKAQMSSLGVEPFGEVGDPFNPELHNAVSHTEDKKLGENVVSQVLQKGYKLKDKVIRHAMIQSAN